MQKLTNLLVVLFVAFFACQSIATESPLYEPKDKELENKYTIQYPQIYLTQAIIYSSLNDLDSLEEAFNKYKAAKTFKEISGMEEKEQALTAYITSRKASNG